MTCFRCQSPRLAKVTGKTSDMCHIEVPEQPPTDSYVPYGMGIGGGDYLRFTYCLHCGQIQDTFPVLGDNLAQ